MRRLSAPLLLILLLSLPLAVCAQVYTWTDAQGTVHYSDSPPAHGAHYQQVKVADTSVAVRGSAPITSEPMDDTASDDEASVPAAPRRVKDTPANRAKLCENLTANLALLEQDGPVVVKDSDGENQLMSKEARAQAQAKMDKQYEQYCQA